MSDLHVDPEDWRDMFLEVYIDFYQTLLYIPEDSVF
jgi:hypothetical protein